MNGPFAGALQDPASERPRSFSDDARRTGALYAVVIAGVWTLVTFGITYPAIPVAAVLGWHFGGSYETRGDRFWSMTLLSVIGTDLLFGFLLGVNLGPATVMELAVLGLVLLGLPGLLIAAISASLWSHFMRRRFSEPTPEGGDRRSADPLR